MNFMAYVIGFAIAALLFSVIGFIFSLCMWSTKGMADWGILTLFMGIVVKDLIKEYLR